MKLSNINGESLFEDSTCDSIKELVEKAISKKISLQFANLSHANLSHANLRGANLSCADLKRANLSDADLSCANLSHANLRGANLRIADLSHANLSDADLSCANLSYANLSYANLSSVNLSGAKMFKGTDYLEQNFEWTPEGLIVYKTFGGQYKPNSEWKTEEGSIIEETVNPLPQNDCGCGINVATKKWVNENYPSGDLWQLIIKNKWLTDVVVSHNTDGKIRCGKAQLIKIVDRKTPTKTTPPLTVAQRIKRFFKIN